MLLLLLISKILTMKKCVSLVLLCLFATAGFAQSSCYVSALAGPSKAYSNFGSKLTSNYGIGFGYEFPNELIKVETGIARTKIFSFFNLYEPWGFYGKKENQVYFSQNSWQIPLRFKVKFWQPNDKITLRAVTGITLSLTPDDYEFKGDIVNLNRTGGQVYFQTSSSVDENTSFYFQRNIWGAVDSNWLIETGLEVGYQLTDKLSSNLGLVYQGGLQEKYGVSIYSKQIDPDTGKVYENIVGSAFSEANALNLSLGISYALSK